MSPSTAPRTKHGCRCPTCKKGTRRSSCSAARVGAWSVALGGSDHYRCYYPAGDDITENLGALDLLTVEALEPGASSWSMLPNAPFSAGAAGDLPGVGLVIVQHDHDSTPGQKRAAWYDWDERVWQELPALPAECQYIESGWVESGRFVVQGPAGPTPEQEAQAAAAGPQFATEQARCSIMCAPDFFSHRFFALDASQPPHLGADPPAGLSHRRRRQLDVQADGVSCAGRLHRTVPPERKLLARDFRALGLRDRPNVCVSVDRRQRSARHMVVGSATSWGRQRRVALLDPAAALYSRQLLVQPH